MFASARSRHRRGPPTHIAALPITDRSERASSGATVAANKAPLCRFEDRISTSGSPTGPAGSWANNSESPRSRCQDLEAVGHQTVQAGDVQVLHRPGTGGKDQSSFKLIGTFCARFLASFRRLTGSLGLPTCADRIAVRHGWARTFEHGAK